MLCNGSISACGAAGVSSILTFRFEESNKSGFDSLQLERVGVTGASSDATSATFRFFAPGANLKYTKIAGQESMKIRLKENWRQRQNDC